MAIDIKGPIEIERMRESCLLAASTLQMAGRLVQPGVSTEAINKAVHKYIVERGAYPSPLNYNGFPKSVCTSINDVICHGIPSAKQVLQAGDIINVDVTVFLNGFHGDTSATFYVGEVSERARALTECARRCLDLGIAQVKPKARIRDIGAAIERYAHDLGFGVVRDYCGHGIGREFHCDPQVPHYKYRHPPNPRMRVGMTFTIEPMINTGTWKAHQLDDGWTVKTLDGGLSAQFEHTVLVTVDGVDVLTDPALLRGSKYDA